MQPENNKDKKDGYFTKLQALSDRLKDNLYLNAFMLSFPKTTH